MLSPRSSSRRLSPKDFGRVLLRHSAKPLRHALGYADELRKRCVIGNEPAKAFAREYELWHRQVEGAVRLLRRGRWSPERLACVVMLDWGLDDADIAEIFNRSVRWARIVREQREEICAEEPIPGHLQWIDDGLQPSDPSPDEIARTAAELRSQRDRAFMEVAPSHWEAPSFTWRATNGTFVPISVA